MLTSRTSLWWRSRAETFRIASGPNLAPTLKEAPVSKGTPTMAKSTPSVVFTWGRRMKDLTPENLGDSRGSTGLYPSMGMLSQIIWV
jgi:hypothetical protein